MNRTFAGKILRHTLSLALVFSNIPAAAADAPAETSDMRTRTLGLKQRGTELLNGANQKIDSHRAGPLAKKVASKYSMSYVSALVLLISKDIYTSLQEEDLVVNPQNVEKKLIEIETNWDSKYKSLCNAIDSTLTFIVAYGGEKSADWVFKNMSGGKIDLTKSKIAGQAIHSLIITTVLSIGVNFFNEYLLLCTRYLIAHPEIADGITEEEMKQLQLLTDRVGMTYFTYGLTNGGPITKSAYRKVMIAFQWIGEEETKTKGFWWSHVLRNNLLNGQTIITLGTSFTAGSLSAKYFPETVKFAKSKKTGFTIAASIIVPALIPDYYQDLLSYYSRIGWANVTSFNRFSSLDDSKNMTDVQIALENAKQERQNITDISLSLAKLASDKIEITMTEQIKIKKALDELRLDPSKNNDGAFRILMLQSADKTKRLESRLKSNYSTISDYNKILNNSLNNIVKTYEQDEQTLIRYLENHPEMRLPIKNTQKEVRDVLTYMKNFKLILTNYYKPEKPDATHTKFEEEEHTSARIDLDRKAYWGFFEEDAYLSSSAK